MPCGCTPSFVTVRVSISPVSPPTVSVVAVVSVVFVADEEPRGTLANSAGSGLMVSGPVAVPLTVMVSEPPAEAVAVTVAVFAPLLVCGKNWMKKSQV